MLNLLNPIGLAALTTLLVPLAIHLWRFPQRTIRLGSLKFLEAVAKPRWNQFRWRDRLLLVLRVTLLAICAVLLARPEWMRLPAAPVRWALRSPGEPALSGPAREEWQTLLAAGFEPRTLAPGLPKFESGMESENRTPMDVWSLLREADARVAAGSMLTVFAPRHVADLQGNRPALAHSTLRWIETPSRERAKWIDALTRVENRAELRVTVGVSESTGTRFLHEVIPSRVGRATVGGIEIEIADDEAAARVVASPPTPWLKVAPAAAIRVLIFFPPSHSDDARAVIAALHAISVVSGREIVVTTNPAEGSVIDRSEWIFSLGGAGPALPALLTAVEKGAKLVTDAGVENAGTDIAATFGIADGGGERIPLWRRIAASSAVGTPLIVDSFGDALLTMEHVGRGRHFRFLSRFHPQWTGWTETSAFPAWMRSLLLPGSDEAGDRMHDERSVSADQVEASATAVAGRPAVIPTRTDLSLLCWLVAAALFTTERVLSHTWSRRKLVERSVAEVVG